MARKRRNKGTRMGAGKSGVVVGSAPNTNLIDANLWQKHLNAKLSPPKQQALDRIVVAGMKVMFSPQTHKMMLQELDAPSDIVTKLAEGITKLMIMLVRHSNGTMPGDLIIPAGGVLLAKVCEFLNKTGEPVSEDQFRQAITQMTHLILKVVGAPDAMTSKLQGQPDQSMAQPVMPQSATMPQSAMPAPTNPLNQGVSP